MSAKTCSKCQTEKDCTDFAKDKHSKDGYTYQCKACRNEVKAKYRKTDSYLERKPVWDKTEQANKRARRERLIALGIVKPRVPLSKEELKARALRRKSQWEVEHPLEAAQRREMIRQKAQTRYQKQKSEQKYVEQQRHRSHLRRARKRDVFSTLTLEDWELCKRAFDMRCAYCGKKKKLTQEHVIPLSAGGSHSRHNIVPACQSCNFRKHTANMRQWYSVQSFYSEERMRVIEQWLTPSLFDVVPQYKDGVEPKYVGGRNPNPKTAPTAKCCVCKQTMDKSEFYKDSSSYNGVMSRCKACDNQRKKDKARRQTA